MLRKPKAKPAIEIPVLCRIWEEDGTWNGSAVHLPIAIFGSNFEEAQRNMSDAIIAHLNALKRIGELESTIAMLRSVSRDPLPVAQMPLRESFIRFGAALEDERLLQLV